MRSNKDWHLADKVALITGGAKGLGAVTAEQLATCGAQVVVVDLQASGSGHATRTDILRLQGDVTSRQDMQAAIEQVVARFGRIDIVVANAGVALRGATVRATSSQAIERLFAINVHGVINTIQAALPQVIEHRGHLALISSVFSYLNGAGTIPYAMTKAAIEQLGRGLRVELASYGVGVTTAYFAMIDTDMIREVVDEDPTAQALIGSLPAVLNKRISPQTAARALIHGIAERSPRVTRPRRWAGVSSIRGALALALDATLSSDPLVQKLIRDLDSRKQ